MPKIHQLQSNFSSGVIDPAMMLRVDTGSYQNGAKELHNVVLRNVGGVTRRPGLERLAEVGAENLVARLKAFEFDEDEVYAFVFYNAGLKIYDADGALLETHGSQPWSEDQLYDLTFAALGDVMLVFHPDFQTRKITRTSLSTFTISTFGYEETRDDSRIYQPHYKFDEDTVTLSPSATTGSITLTASSAIFDATLEVGKRYRLYGAEVLITGYTDSTHIVGTVKGAMSATFDPDPFRTFSGLNVVSVTHVAHGLTTGTSLTLQYAEAVGGITAANLNGARTITVVDANTYTFVAGANATASADGGGPSVRYDPSNLPTREWTEPAFSSERGWPRCGCFHGNRLWLAGSPELPAGLVGSKVGRYFNFDLGEAEDTDGLFVIAGQDRIAAIRHLVSSTHLQVFTTRGEYYIPRADGQPITPGTITVDKQTPFGISQVTPFPFDGATLFLQESKTALREFIYSDQERKYSANSVTITASHVLDEPFDMAVVYGTDERPELYAHLINADGTMAVFHSARVERLAGWTTWETEGLFVSATTLNNRLVVLVSRADGTYLERANEALTLDSATTYEAGTNMVLTSYANSLGTGNRSASITVTDSGGGLIFAGSSANLVNGDTSTNNTYFNGAFAASGAWIKFDFGTAKVIDGIKWYQQNVATNHGVWKLQGSTDNAAWTDVGASFTLGFISGVSQVLSGVQVTEVAIASASTGYRYYRLLGVSGTTDSSPYIYEIDFKIGTPVTGTTDTGTYIDAARRHSDIELTDGSRLVLQNKNAGTAWRGALSTTAKTSGIYYLEVQWTTLNASGRGALGFANTSGSLTAIPGAAGDNTVGYISDNDFYRGNAVVATNAVADHPAGDWIGVEVDMTASARKFRVKDVTRGDAWSAWVDLGSNTQTGDVYLMVSLETLNSVATVNFGASAFVGTLPSGTLPWDLVAQGGASDWLTDYDDTVTVVTDGYSFGEQDGPLISVDEVESITVGYDFTWRVVTLPPVIQDANKGTLLGETKRLAGCTIGLTSAMEATEADHTVTLDQIATGPDDTVEETTTYFDHRFLGYAQAPELTITASDPLPVTIMGVVLKVSA